MGTQQASIDLGEPGQNDLTFPVTLAEKYQPRIEDFLGLEEPKRVMLGLLANPKPCNLLFVGDPGCGKTIMAMKFAEQLPAAHHHIRAQSADVATLDRIWELCQYYPARGRFHLVHIDEVDGATEKAQLQLLSRMDGTACLRPVFGGGFERGEVPPIINVFTCNGRTIDGKMTPPASLLPRFLSRCIVLTFDPVPMKELARYLRTIWEKEGGPKGRPIQYFEDLAEGQGVRDALMRLDSELLAPRSLPEIRQRLAEKKAREKQRAAENLVIFEAKRRDEAEAAPIEVNHCAHKDAPHHGRGLCVLCYRKFRREQRRRRRA
jgi:DNA polymerase III delta prime subunit